jgi:hypothetical protein
LLCVGRVRSKSREEQPAARTIAATPQQKSETIGLQLTVSKQGIGPALFFGPWFFLTRGANAHALTA